MEQHKNKQYIEQHKNKYIEQHKNKQYIEQHRKYRKFSAGRAPSMRVLPWQLPLQLRKKHGKPQSG
jgi:ribosomal protein S8E